jgi:hypothetical protein
MESRKLKCEAMVTADYDPNVREDARGIGLTGIIDLRI